MKRKTPATIQIGVATCAFVFEASGAAPSEIQLTPAGWFRARDGRPEGLRGWYIDATVAARVIARNDQYQDELVIDYEHQTLHTRDNGREAPAAGWFKRLEWREGLGLFAVDSRWTARAATAIGAGEYRYLSPVLLYDKRSGEVLAVAMAALTNYAAIDGMVDLHGMAERVAARFLLEPTTPKEGTPVNREQLIELLGLAEEATDEQIRVALTALKAQADTHAALRQTLALDADTDLAAVVTALKTRAEAATTPDPAKFVPVDVVSQLQGEVAALTTKLTQRDLDELIADALETGKLLPAMESWARSMGAKDLAALRSYLDVAQPIAALKGRQSGGKAPEGDEQGALDDNALAVCRQLGVSAEEFQKTRAQLDS